MRISVFGLGYVGCISLGCLAKNGHSVIGVDSNPDKVDLINSGRATIIEKEIDEIISSQRSLGRIKASTDYRMAVVSTDLSVIAVGTPSSANGHLDLSFVKKVCEQIGSAIKEKTSFHTILVRSTVPPGTNDSLSKAIEEVSNKKIGRDFAVISNPEFLREGTAVLDYYHPPFTVIGTNDSDAAEIVRELYRQIPGEVIVTRPRVAEMIKYVNNSFHALKVSFANEVGNICKSLGVDSNQVMEIFVKDTNLNISPCYLRPGFAYGGSCLPKDLRGLKALAHDNYVEATVLDSISKSNEVQIKRSVDLIVSQNKKRIGFVGLSFKAGTDDLRNSPAVTVIETLLGKGYQVIVYDRNIALSKLTGTNWRYVQEHLPHLSALLVHDVEKLIEGSEIIVLATGEKCILGNSPRLAGKILVDLTGAGLEYSNTTSYVGLSW
jgi:GDP-mannose 6-dehydrogenase